MNELPTLRPQNIVLDKINHMTKFLSYDKI
jgi:hypothetical protein